MTAETIPKPKASESVWSDSDPVVLVLTIGFILLFVGASVVDAEFADCCLKSLDFGQHKHRRYLLL